jgi:hypothetical protein
LPFRRSRGDPGPGPGWLTVGRWSGRSLPMETAAATPTPDDDARRGAIEARIDRFSKPTCLDPEVAARVLPRLKELTRLAGPTTPEDAKNLLSAGCRLIADSGAADVNVDVDAVLSEEAVARWSHAARRARMPAGTLANILRFLNRLVRARNGLPPRVTTRRAPAAAPPLLEGERLHRLAEALVSTDPAAAAALVAAAGAGVVATSEAVAVCCGGERVVVQGGESVPVTAVWCGMAGRLAGTVADSAGWGRLRAAAATAGIEVTGRALRLRWAVDVVAAAATPQSAVRAGVPLDLLNRAVARLAPVDDDTARAALRG